MEHNNKTLAKFHGPSKNRLKIFSVVFVVTMRVFKKVKTYITNKMKKQLTAIAYAFCFICYYVISHSSHIYFFIDKIQGSILHYSNSSD